MKIPSSRPKTGKRHPPGVPSQHNTEIPWARDHFIPMSKQTEYSSVYIPHAARKEKHRELRKEASEYQYNATSVGDFLSTTQIHRRYYATPKSGSNPGTPLDQHSSFIRNDSSASFPRGDFLPPYFRSFTKASNLPGSKSKTKNMYFTRYCQSAPTSRPSTGGYDQTQSNGYDERPYTTGQSYRPQSGYGERSQPSAFSDMNGYPNRSQPGYPESPYVSRQQSVHFSPEGQYGFPDPRGNYYDESTRQQDAYMPPPPGYGNPQSGIYSQYTQDGYYIPPGAYNETTFTQEQEVNDQFSALKTEVVELHKVDNQGEWNFSKESSRFEKTIEGFQPASSFGETKPDLKNKPNPLLKVKETKVQEKPSSTEKSPIIEEIFDDKSTTSVLTNTHSTVNTSTSSNTNSKSNASTISLVKLPIEVTLTSQTSTNLTENGSVEEVEVEIHGSKTRTIITKPGGSVKTELKTEPVTIKKESQPAEDHTQTSNAVAEHEDDDFIKHIMNDLKAILNEKAKAFAKCRIQQVLYEARFLTDSDELQPLRRGNRRREKQFRCTAGDIINSPSFSLANRDSNPAPTSTEQPAENEEVVEIPKEE